MSINFHEFGYVRVAAASIPVEIAAPQANAVRIIQTCANLAQQHVSVAVFPELCLSGYTAEDLFADEQLLTNCQAALQTLCTEVTLPMLVVGLPWRLPDGRLLNCAAVISQGRVVGLVPKSNNPNHGEFYDLRWFVNGGNVNEVVVHATLGAIPLRVDQLFDMQGVRVGVEICEDLWAPDPPNTPATLAGAEIMLNLSASNELIAKADYRRDLVRMTSARTVCAYVYCAAGPSESTKDVVFGGHHLIAENGVLLGESERFNFDGTTLLQDIDVQHLRHDRAHNTSFAGSQRRTYRTHTIDAPVTLPDLLKPPSQHPFVPADEHEVEARAQEILRIQTTGLTRRLTASRSQRMVIGLSGGLDSTLAFLVCLDTIAATHRDPSDLVALTMPGPGTTEGTLSNARTLAQVAGADLQEIPIGPAVEQHLTDLQHDGAHDVVFENSQARERTQLLFNYANKVGGLVVGTGDLSELALGWCTYNADHMASYNVNASIPKTLIAYLVRWYTQHRATPELQTVLEAVLDTPISPELIPPTEGEISQITEDIVGPYELHDFFMYHLLRYGSTPDKIYQLARLAFADAYDAATIRGWLRTFYQRFFSQQFKRTTLPPGPKVGSVSLSPRGDWRMPDEAQVAEYLAVIDALG